MNDQGPSATRLARALAFVQARRSLLSWAALSLLLLLLIGAAGQWAARREADLQADAIHRAIDVHKLALLGAADKYNYLPFTAARHPVVIEALTHPADAALIQRANSYLQEVNQRAGSVALYVMDVQGRALAASNWSTPQSFVGQDYANRPYFIDALQGGRGEFYGVGKTTGEPGLFMSVPVRRDQSILGVVAVKVSLRQIQDTWAQSRDPVMLADRRGVFFLGSVASWLYQSTVPLSADDRQWLHQHDVYGPGQNFALIPWSVQRHADHEGYLLRTRMDGQERSFLALDESLPDLGWTLTVTKDYTSVTAARNRTWVLGTLGAALALLAAAYWRLRERRYHEQLQARQELEVRVRERTQELGQAHAFRKAMEDSLLVGMRARDLQGRIIYVNPALCEMTGYRAEELIGRLPPYPYWHPDDLQKHWDESEAALAGQAALTGFESRIRHRDGHDVHTMVYTAPLIDVNGQHSGWMSSVVDISEQKRAEGRQRQHDEQLQHAQRLASLGEMASTLAHELNQPLMALSNFASAGKAFAAQGHQTLLINSLDEITTQAQRAGEIVRRIKGFVRQRTRGNELCQINDMVLNVVALLKAEVRRQHTRIETQLQGGLPAVEGDQVLLEQVLMNLVLNGLQAMQHTPKPQRLIEIATVQEHGRVKVTVTDHGSGIEPAAAGQIFDAFYTTKSDGLGLGLNICRTIIESHGGRLSFENGAVDGATFTFELPCPT